MLDEATTDWTLWDKISDVDLLTESFKDIVTNMNHTNCQLKCVHIKADSRPALETPLI